MSNKTIAILTKNAPAPIGPYSQAVLTMNNQMLFVSGTLPLDATGNIIHDIPQATKQVLDYISALMVAADMDLQNIVKTTIYLTDMHDFAQMNQVYLEYFKNNNVLPARETVAVKALPKGAALEISVIAVRS